MKNANCKLRIEPSVFARSTEQENIRLPLSPLSPFSSPHAATVFPFSLPFFRSLNITTAYEYLERRFNLAARLYGSVSFIAFQLVRMSIVVYLPAIALSAITGLDS